MITANVWERVVEVGSDINSGTGFTIDGPRGQYLVSARHLFPKADIIHVRIVYRSRRYDLHLEPLKVASPDADVVVALLPEPITPPDLPLPATSDGMIFGQRAYFVGFPHGVGMSIGGDARFPLVKGCVVSGTLSGPEPERKVLLLDGFNNPGFSGGPVVLLPGERDLPLQVIGVVSGFLPEEIEQPEGWNVSANSGIVVATPIEAVTSALS
ncbi:MAG: trypsin-like peptidase domain-containing protein [Ilumatobacteraceae bacterium]|nr:trypsin-like peptidase domain-containing protein [Ilumatobacteraceae bacterium]